MKKSILAVAGLAAVAGVVGPVAGAFAATDGDGTMSTTDTVVVTIANACSLTASGNTNAFTANIANGAVSSNIGSTTISIVCNDTAGWKVMAKGANASTTSGAGVTDMAPAKATSTPIATGAITASSTSSTTSVWGMKLSDATDVITTNVSTYFSTDYVAIPNSDTKVAEGNSTATASFKTNYKVGISATQQADTYTGKVTYTLVHPNSEVK